MTVFSCSPNIAVRHSDSAPLVSFDGSRTVVWLRGEHDIATSGVLAATLDWAIAARDTSVVVDMRRVTFIDAGTIGVLVRARNHLRADGRDLAPRSLSACARHVLATYGLGDWVEVAAGS